MDTQNTIQLYVARDKGACRCCAFAHLPKRWGTFWADGKGNIDSKLMLPSDKFPNIRWEDEPQLIICSPAISLNDDDRKSEPSIL